MDIDKLKQMKPRELTDTLDRLSIYDLKDMGKLFGKHLRGIKRDMVDTLVTAITYSRTWDAISDN